MIRRQPHDDGPPSALDPLRRLAHDLASRAVHATWERVRLTGATGHRHSRARRYGRFGRGTVVGFPTVVVNERHIHLGDDVVIADGATVTAGWGVGHRGLPEVVVRIGDRSLLGPGSSIIAHELVDIGDDVWTGRNVHITDMNHGYTRLDVPISEQWQGTEPITIGDGSWLGHHVVVLAGARIGRHVTVGAGSVVKGELPDFSVAVGAPARVVRRHDPERGWLRVHADGTEEPDDPDLRQLGLLAAALETATPAEREAVAALAAALQTAGR